MTKLAYNYFSFIYLIHLILISGKLLANATLIEDICRQTHEPDFCFRVLGSDPRTRNARLPELASVVIDLATYSATSSKVKIRSLYLSAKDPLLKARFVMCETYYADALDALKTAINNLKNGDNRDLNKQGAATYDDGLDCENSFKPTFQSPLTKENNALKEFGEMIAAIANSPHVIA